jgi:DNA replication protein DnaC
MYFGTLSERLSNFYFPFAKTFGSMLENKIPVFSSAKCHTLSMETSRYALLSCKLCGGKGRVKTGEGITEWAVCPCAVAGLRRDAADKLLRATLPPRARDMTLDNFKTGNIKQNEQALKAARNFIDNYERAAKEGWVLGFFGEPRTGKTHLAIAIAQAITKRYLARPSFANLPRALREERERFRNPDLPSPLQAAAEADFLVLDDLGAEYERMADDSTRVSWLSEQVYLLLDDRIMNNKPFIYTTNLSRSDMERKYQNEAWQRVFARLREAEVNPAGALEIVRVSGVERSSEAAGILFS